MITKKRIRKAAWSIRNEGPRVFSKKLVNFIPWAIGRSHLKYSKYLPGPLRANNGKYTDDYIFLSNDIFNVTSEDIAKSIAIQSEPRSEEIGSATWFVPYFNHLAFGGIFTIFRFINSFAENGVDNTIVIYDKPDLNIDKTKDEIAHHFPHLANVNLIAFNPETDDLSDLPATDMAVCTFWVSAYFLLKFNQTKRKYYFIQDYEPLFYEGGSMSALAESTYRFGFEGIVNTPGLLRAINLRHGLQGVSFVPAVDSRYYFHAAKDDNKRIRIFFYARPGNPRNAFYLGILIIKQLLKKYGDQIEIITAGSEWNEASYGLKGSVTNLGLLNSLEEVGALYRTCDIGFVYMLSKHPSYQPFEFMASGVATVTNNNEDNLWFLQDASNCLIAEPSPAAMAEKISWLIDNKALRNKIQKGGFSTVSDDWSKQLSLIWDYLTRPMK